MQKSAHWAYLEGYYPPQIVLLLPLLLSVKHSYSKHTLLQQVKQIGRDVVSSVHLTASMTHFKIFNTGKSGPDLQFNCISCQNTWNLNQIIPTLFSHASYYGYAEYLTMGSCGAATGCCRVYVSPGHDFSLTSTERKVLHCRWLCWAAPGLLLAPMSSPPGTGLGSPAPVSFSEALMKSELLQHLSVFSCSLISSLHSQSCQIL